MTDINKFMDDMVATRSRSVVFAAGNRGNSDGCVSSPALAYNVIAVGSSDDNNTTDWADDTVAGYSSYKDPTTTNNDREEPDVMAPGTNFQSTKNADPWTGDVGSGTSYAAPVVTGVIADLFQRAPSLRILPASVRAILMATAAHNIEGDARLSEKDGAGEIVAQWADDIIQNLSGTFGAYIAPAGQVPRFPDLLRVGRRQAHAHRADLGRRHVLYFVQQQAERRSGHADHRPVGQRRRQLGQLRQQLRNRLLHAGDGRHYKVRVIRSRWSTDVTRGMSYAVFQGDPLLLPTPVPPTADVHAAPDPHSNEDARAGGDTYAHGYAHEDADARPFADAEAAHENAQAGNAAADTRAADPYM